MSDSILSHTAPSLSISMWGFMNARAYQLNPAQEMGCSMLPRKDHFAEEFARF